MTEAEPIFLKRPLNNGYKQSTSREAIDRVNEPRSFSAQASNSNSQTRLLEDIVYSREILFEIREFHDTGSRQEVLTIRIFRLGPERDPEGYKLEIVHAEDIFFQYQTLIHANSYRAIQTKQNLTADFAQFLDIIVKILDDCCTNDNFTAIFKYKSDGQAKVAFFQNLGYKFIELLSLDFQGSTDQEIKEHVKRSYRLLKTEYQQVKSRLSEVLNVVKAKNPSLLLYLQQSTNQYETVKSGRKY